MSKHLITAAIGLTIEPKDPPGELRIFKAGQNPSLKGVFLFDAAAAQSVMASWKAMGHSLSVDYDHASLDQKPLDPAKSKKSAGLFDLAVRNGELWAVNVRWTEEAADGIRKGEWPFISPAFHSDDKGRPQLLLNFALTANPALFNAPQLIAASVFLGVGTGGAIPFHGYPLLDKDTWDGDAAEHRIRKWASSDGSGDTDKIDWKKYGQAFAYQKTPGPNGPALGDFALPHHDVDAHGNLMTSRKGTIAAAQRLPQTDIPTADLPAVREHLAKHYAQWGAQAPWVRTESAMKKMTYSKLNDMMKQYGVPKAKMAKALDVGADELDALLQSDDPLSPEHEKAYDTKIKGLWDTYSGGNGPDSDNPFNKMKKGVSLHALSVLLTGTSDLDHDEALARAGELRAGEIKILSVTGAKDLDRALTMINRLSAFGADLKSMTGKSDLEEAFREAKSVFDQKAEIARQAERVKGERVTQMLSVAQGQGKITPAEIDGPHGLRALGLENPERLEAMLKSRPVIASLVTDNGDRQVGREDVTLSNADNGRGQWPPAGQAIGGDVTALNLAGGDGKPVTLNGLTYEKIDSATKANLKHGSVAEQRAFHKLHADWESRGKPLPSQAA